ncbi:hypothetical protein JZ751_003220 [Albula glossodonta]|uniref:Uncharacterized protein n=1 Tax=Albula glossodonta TaxID=121402 RepID=A0A8T2NGR2_9TELE|nr:hypothetical protein JZ751_003220 [Albula glossodonta]
MEPPSSEDKCEGYVEYLHCGGAVTEVLKFGARDLHHASRLHSNPRVVFLLIPGSVDKNIKNGAEESRKHVNIKMK